MIHELAAALDVPGFGTQLAEIAERGRGLGLHVIASTRRPLAVAAPAPPVAFTTRIALRLDDPADAVAATGSPDAAALPGIVGRGVLVTEDGTPSELQAATVIAEPDDDTVDDMFGSHRIDVVPFVLGRDLTSLERRLLWGRDERAATSATPDVRSLVEAIIARGDDRAEVVVQPSLPRRIPFRAFLDDHPGDAVPFALADRPDEQRWDTLWWAPGTNISFIGAPGSGATSLLLTVALGCVERHVVDDVHLYVVANQPQWLNSLAPLPHVGAVVGTDDPERLSRLVTWLDDELERRSRAAEDDDQPGADSPHIVVLVDDVGAALEAVAHHPGLEPIDEPLHRILDTGPDHRISSITTALDERRIGSRHPRTVRLVAQLPDDFAYAAVGIDAEYRPADLPGRAVAVGVEVGSSGDDAQADDAQADDARRRRRRAPMSTRPTTPADVDQADDAPADTAPTDDAPELVEIQIIAPPSPLHGAVTALLTDVGGGPAARPPYRVEPFVVAPPADTLAAGVDFGGHAITVGIGRNRGTGGIATLQLTGNAPTLVLGEDEAACTEVLCALAEVARAAAELADEELTICALADRDSRLARSSAVDRTADPTDLAAWVEQITAIPGRRLVLIDEAGRYTDPKVADLVADRDADLLCVIAGRGIDLRSPLHWLTKFPQPQQALLLRPSPVDADVLGVTLPGPVEAPTARGGLTAPMRRDRPYLVVDGEWTPVAPLVPSTTVDTTRKER